MKQNRHPTVLFLLGNGEENAELHDIDRLLASTGLSFHWANCVPHYLFDQKWSHIVCVACGPPLTLPDFTEVVVFPTPETPPSNVGKNVQNTPLMDQVIEFLRDYAP